MKYAIDVCLKSNELQHAPLFNTKLFVKFHMHACDNTFTQLCEKRRWVSTKSFWLKLEMVQLYLRLKKYKYTYYFLEPFFAADFSLWITTVWTCFGLWSLQNRVPHGSWKTARFVHPKSPVKVFPFFFLLRFFLSWWGLWIWHPSCKCCF